MNVETIKKVMNVPYAIIITSFVIIFITINVVNKNALSALIGGFSGLLLGLLFALVILMSQPNAVTIDLIPMGILI